MSDARPRRRGAVLALAVAGVAGVVLAGSGPVGAAEGPDGQQLFESNCASCHGAQGQGTPGQFPPLAGNPSAEDTEYVLQVINEGLSGPIEVDGTTYDAQMPALTHLSDEEAGAIANYVATELAAGDGEPAPEPTPTAEPVTPDPQIGESLFVGSRDLLNGGPACVACHTAGGYTALGGSSMGPDLTTLQQRFGDEAAIRQLIANPPSPVMQPIFGQGQKVLTDDEIAHLTAFLARTAPQQQPAEQGPDWLLVLGASAAAALVLLLGVLWRGRHQHFLDRRRPDRARS